MKTSNVPISSPCGRRFSAMRTDQASVWCDDCEQSVRNLSLMAEDDAKELVRSSKQLCVLYAHDEGGSIHFAPPTTSRNWWATIVAAAALATAPLQVACGGMSVAAECDFPVSAKSSKEALERVAVESGRATVRDTAPGE